MKFKFIFLLILFYQIHSAQQLTIEQTVNYINEKLGEWKSIDIKSDGTLKMTELIPDIYWDHSISFEEMKIRWNAKQYKLINNEINEADVHSLIVEKNILNNEFVTELKCNSSPCIVQRDYRREQDGFPRNVQEIFLFSQLEKDRDKIYNAFKYLFGLIKESGAYQNSDDDPFSNKNFKNTISSISGIKSKEEVKLSRESGVFFINVNISGIQKRFVLDSGASEISLSAEFEKELIAKKILTKENYIESALYRNANGSVESKRRVILPEIKIGDFIVKNIPASIGSSNIPLLLGKSFLDKFSKWTIDNNAETLTLEK